MYMRKRKKREEEKDRERSPWVLDSFLDLLPIGERLGYLPYTAVQGNNVMVPSCQLPLTWANINEFLFTAVQTKPKQSTNQNKQKKHLDWDSLATIFELDARVPAPDLVTRKETQSGPQPQCGAAIEAPQRHPAQDLVTRDTRGTCLFHIPYPHVPRQSGSWLVPHPGALR